MKFSYKKGDTYRMALRGSRPLGMYMYTAVIQHTHWNVPVWFPFLTSLVFISVWKWGKWHRINRQLKKKNYIAVQLLNGEHWALKLTLVTFTWLDIAWIKYLLLELSYSLRTLKFWAALFFLCQLLKVISSCSCRVTQHWHLYFLLWPYVCSPCKTKVEC